MACITQKITLEKKRPRKHLDQALGASWVVLLVVGAGGGGGGAHFPQAGIRL